VAGLARAGSSVAVSCLSCAEAVHGPIHAALQPVPRVCISLLRPHRHPRVSQRLSRPDQVVYFFRQVVGVETVDKPVLRERTTVYQHWVEAYARNHAIPIEWAVKGVRKETQVAPYLRRLFNHRDRMADARAFLIAPVSPASCLCCAAAFRGRCCLKNWAAALA